MIPIWFFYLLLNLTLCFGFWVLINKIAFRVYQITKNFERDNLLVEWMKDITSNVEYIARYLGLFPGLILLADNYFSGYFLVFILRLESILLIILGIVCVNNLFDKFEIHRVDIVKANDQLNKRELTFQLTLIPLAVSGFKYITYAVGVIVSLLIFKIDIAPIINAAGIGLIVLSFFFKSVFEDIIASAFIFIEGKFYYGSYLKIGSFKGRVVKITWSSTYLEENGKIFVISNRTINNLVIIKDDIKKDT